MYRITTDFHGGNARVFGSIDNPGGGSIQRARQFANASLIGANGTFPDLDMLPMGLLHCSDYFSQAHCSCNACNGTGDAYVLASVWAMARSPLLAGGSFPMDPITVSLLTNKDMLFVHAYATNQTVFEFFQPNMSCTPKTDPPCDWMAHGWDKWQADIAAPTQNVASEWGERYIRAGTASTVANRPIKAVLLINAGHAQNTYPNPTTAPSGRLTTTTWTSLGLDAAASYTARDVFSQLLLPSNTTGFTVNVTGFNATLVLVHKV
eukprot:m.209384 g.209384  ORF g.209384 m.209384 type:complete len:264 (-) comp33036_c0_seq13:178-969(-)